LDHTNGDYVTYHKITASLCWALLLLWSAAAWGQAGIQLGPAPSIVELLPIELDRRDANRTEFDRLKLLGAFQLRSKDTRFGGLSGLAIGADGRFYAVSDRGFWLSARMHVDARGKLLNLSDWQIARLLTPEKTPVSGPLTDAEALGRSADGSFIVAFEQAHRIWRYRPPPEIFHSAAVPVPTPSEILKAPRNGGLEAVSVLPDGRIFAIAEELENPDGSLHAWLIDNGHFGQLSYVPSDGFRPSDATALKNGDVLVLERRYNLLHYFSARLKMVKAQNLRPGAKLSGEELLRLDSPLTVDNFEGVAALETNEGAVIFLVSDDNYFRFQRTLLLQFLLPNTRSAAD
jgi:hypothetical protein